MQVRFRGQPACFLIRLEKEATPEADYPKRMFRDDPAALRRSPGRRYGATRAAFVEQLDDLGEALFDFADVSDLEQ